MWRLSTVILTLLCAAFVVMVLGSIEVGGSLNYTCVLCRLGRVDRTMFGLTHSTYHDNECSRWYSANVEPIHHHLWARGTCKTLLNAFGRPMGVACNLRQCPIGLLPPSTQMQVYQHFPDRQQAKGLFTNLTDAKTHDDRLDEHDEPRGDLIVRSLVDWESAGFPGAWADWWTRWWVRHVADHNEWLTWLHSDSHMSFDDWQASQQANPPHGNGNAR